ncbi:alpha/beta-hydrolase [Clavulina sp. PMI_390]|nr:alpha/beta-hydrolase [Clavulina sp. PMI_390]
MRIPSATTGWELEAWQFLPSDVSSKPPVVVMAHGTGLTKASSLRPHAEVFAAQGYGVLVFDYRRFGGSDGTPRNMLIINERHEDYSTVINYARSCELFDPKRVVAWGTSFSGGHVITIAGKDHELAAVIAQCPFTDGIASGFHLSKLPIVRTTPIAIYDLVRSLLPWYKPTYIKAAAQPGHLGYLAEPGFYDGMYRITPNPQDFPNQLQASEFMKLPFYRPVRAASRIQCPILVTIAKADNIVPPGAVLKVARRAPLGESVQFEGTHFDCYQGGASFEAGLRAQIEFLQRVLSPPIDHHEII